MRYGALKSLNPARKVTVYVIFQHILVIDIFNIFPTDLPSDECQGTSLMASLVQ